MLQILAYYETVLASLLETGRVTWLPHTEHGEGDRLKSLLQVRSWLLMILLVA